MRSLRTWCLLALVPVLFLVGATLTWSATSPRALERDDPAAATIATDLLGTVAATPSTPRGALLEAFGLVLAVVAGLLARHRAWGPAGTERIGRAASLARLRRWRAQLLGAPPALGFTTTVTV